MGTAKAMEMGKVEGAMSSLSIAVTSILTVIGVSIFLSLYNFEGGGIGCGKMRYKLVVLN